MTDYTVIGLHRSDIVAYGPLNAIVLTQIRWHTNPKNINATEWFTASSEDLAKECGLGADQVRRAVRSLIERGAIEKAKHRSKGASDHTLSYRPIHLAESPTSSFGESATSSFLPEEENNNTRQTTTPKPPKRRRAKNIADVLTPLESEIFETWWKRFPSKKRKPDAIKAWRNAIDAGVIDRIDSALDHYVTSIDLYRNRHNNHDTDLPFQYGGVSFIEQNYLLFADGPILDLFDRHTEQTGAGITNGSAIPAEYLMGDE
jgi:hypothetical protein